MRGYLKGDVFFVPMKIAAIGDPHGDVGLLRKIPLHDVDLILLTGDLGSASLMRKMAFENVERRRQGLSEKKYTPAARKRAFMEAYSSSIRVVKYLSRFAPVYTIYGNVESSNAVTRKESKAIGLPLPFLTDSLNALPNVRVINNRLVRFNNIRIGGLEYFIDTNWVQEFKPADYQKRLVHAKKATARAKGVLNKFGAVDILLCHQPPYSILDKVTSTHAPKHWQGKHAGSKTILQYMKQQRPNYVFCGHIHEGEGTKKIESTKVYNLGVGKYCIVEF
jgi:Icc-related predicted phosphoesterase